MIQIDNYAYKSKLINVDPKGKLIFSITILSICLLMNSPSVGILTIFIMGLITINTSGISMMKYLKLLSIPLIFLIIGTITVMINRYDTGQSILMGVHLGKYQYGMDKVSLFKGITLITRALGSVSAMYFLALNTPMTELFEFLRGTKLPNLVVSLMELIYRFIFIIWEEASNMRVAQESRLGNINFKTAVRSTGEMISMLFIRAYKRADRVFMSLESRGYNGEVKFFKEEYNSAMSLYLGTCIVSLILIGAALVEKIIF
ncbi:MAG: cobalt ECF transporter T component CbiQ [Clostridium sp.]